MSENATRVACAVGGLLLGGLVIAVALKLAAPAAEDDERPPIIVKGGSLIFESGDASSSDLSEKIGKPWIQVGQDWQPDHKKGKKTKWFSVQIPGPNTASCPALAMTKEMTITYRSAQGLESEFRITTKPRPGSGTAAPTVVGTGLAADNAGDNPKLTFDKDGEGSISRVQFQAHGTGNVDCRDPDRLIVWQF